MRRQVIVLGLVAVAAAAVVSLAAITQARVGRHTACAPARMLRAKLAPPTAHQTPPSITRHQDSIAASDDKHEPHDAAVINDILEIRRRQGVQLFDNELLDRVLVGDEDPLAGTATEFHANNFTAALLRVTGSSIPDSSVATAARLEACEQQYERSLRLGDGHELIVALRTVGRQLDLHADEREVDQQFQHADRLRRLADRLRKEARALDGEYAPDP